LGHSLTTIFREAFDKVKALILSKNDQQQLQLFKRKPELKFLMRTPEAIMKQHVNDFKNLTVDLLDDDEARALYHNMPKFYKTQDKQIEFVEKLKYRIEHLASLPKRKPPPPIAATKKVIIRKPDSEAQGGGGFLEELLKKRKKRD
jgi:hypothetical protein